jgi:endoglucanase
MHCKGFGIAALVAALLLGGNAQAADEPQPAFHRGLALSGWLANAARHPIFEWDFAQIKQVGFDHVRLPVNPDYFGFKVGNKGAKPLVDVRFKAVDIAIDLARKHGLQVILDVHFNDDTTKAVEKNAGGEDALVALWSDLAKRYKDYPDNVLAFELINEPLYYYNNAGYQKFVSRLVAAVRAESPTRWIIIGATRSSSVETLQELQPLDDARVMYTFHFYEPYMVTHQGVHGFPGSMLSHFRGVPYPAALADKPSEQYAPDAPDRALANDELEKYRKEGWDYERLNAIMTTAGKWAKAHKARVLCTEFGAHRFQPDAASRYRWISDARKAMDANNIGWNLWDYTDLFGIARLEGKVTAPDPGDGSIRLVDPPHGRRVIDAEAAAALGLTAVEATAAAPR